MKLTSANNILKYVSNNLESSAIGLGILTLIAIFEIGYLMPSFIFLSIFYIIPVVIVTWFVNGKTGLFFSSLSTMFWFATINLLPKSYDIMNFYLDAAILLGFLIVFTYILESFKTKYQNQKLLALTDVLTCAFNRRFFLDSLEKEKQRFLRYKRPFTVAYIDIDNFKKINDSLGHKIGDRLLQSIAQTISRQIRVTDVLARLGGDEFALLLPETNYESAKVLLKRLQRKLALENQLFPVTYSIGAITFLQLPNTVEEIVERADRLMYEVKHSSKNALRHEILDSFSYGDRAIL